MNLQEQQALRTLVRDTYAAVAMSPEAEHPIPVGHELAAGVGYTHELLDRLPAVAIESFAGVSNVSIFAHFPQGATVLDVGCGTGLDSLIAAERVGPGGRVIGLDFGDAMIARAHQAAHQLGTNNLSLCVAEGESLPLGDATIDVALVNGIFNLNPGRQAIFQELSRVLRPGGSLYAAELILREPLPQAERADPSNWFA
jgi:arsenite methyltransferase